MDKETVETLNRIVGLLEFQGSHLDELKEQVGINCIKLDKMDQKLDSIVEIVTANGQGIEVLSKRIDELE